jgi:acylphosphatase
VGPQSGEPEAVITRGWLVSGRVQGVGFRYFVQRKASSLGLAGWTRNLPDGQVQILARGPVAALAALAAELRTGPPLAQVSTVAEVGISDEVINRKTFEIR